MPAVMRMSCITAMSTGTAYFGSNRSAMYAEITTSDAMIAMIAEFATVAPNVGPIEVELGTSARSYWRSSAARTLSTSVGLRLSVEIWNWLAPLDPVSDVTRWISALPRPSWVSTSRMAFSSTFCVSATLMRVPDSKSMPKLMPLDPRASAQTSRMTPDALKNHFE